MFYLITAEEKIGPVLPPSVRELFGSRAERSKYWYDKVLKNPICFRKASKRFFFILTTSYSLKSYLKNLYCVLIEDDNASIDDNRADFTIALEEIF